MHYTACPVEPLSLTPGDKLRFAEEPNTPYKVRATSEHFALLTRQQPFRPMGVYLYTVVDWRNGVRGPINVVGQGWECKTDEQCRDLIAELEAGEWEVSHRNWLRIRVNKHDRCLAASQS